MVKISEHGIYCKNCGFQLSQVQIDDNTTINLPTSDVDQLVRALQFARSGSVKCPKCNGDSWICMKSEGKEQK